MTEGYLKWRAGLMDRIVKAIEAAFQWGQLHDDLGSLELPEYHNYQQTQSAVRVYLDHQPTFGNESLETLEAERAFLVARIMLADPWKQSHRRVGISSNALVRYVFTGQEPTEQYYPRDEGDLARCERTVKMMPRHLAERAAPVVEKYRAFVGKRYPTVLTPEWSEMVLA